MSKSNKEPHESEEAAESPFKVEDRRHWAAPAEDARETDEAAASPYPSIIDEYKQRTAEAEQKLKQYIEAFKSSQREQEEFRTRLNADVERRVQLGFGELVEDLLGSLDDLDLALSHVDGVPEAEPLAKGVTMARDRFLSALERHGVSCIRPDGEEFDPNEAEALRLEPVSEPEQNGKVVQTLRPGYRLGDRVIRAARVTVGKLGDN